jgi:4-amino-4-deoxy-L-arabinose transferase-like glycosyltransferase
MAAFLKRLTDQRILLASILITLPFKLGYVLSRDLFSSGPDADTYIPATIDFSRQSFFSSDITGMPYWPAGYPSLNSMIVRVSESRWIEITQIFQVLIFSLACFLYFKMILPYFGRFISLLSSLFLTLQPAWVVANGEAMYETYLFSFIIIGFYFVLKSHKQNDRKGISAGLLLLGYSLAIHPRILPIILGFFVLLQLQLKSKLKEILISLGIFAFFPITFALRNLIAENSFTLSTALVGTASSYNEVFRDCTKVECIPSTILTNFPALLSQGFTNLNHFFSPHWGPDSRGTWFHNLSGLFLFPEGVMSQNIVLFGTLVSWVSIFFLVLGTWGALRRRNLMDYFFVFSSLTFLFTAFVVFGDNRHRLIASFSLLPLQFLGTRVFLDFLKISSLKILSPFREL